MEFDNDPARLQALLARLMDELCAADLTIARSQVLRAEVARLLEWIEAVRTGQRPERAPAPDLQPGRNGTIPAAGPTRRRELHPVCS